MNSAILALRDINFRKKLLKIAIPVSLQNLINFSVSAADVIMVGQLGEVELSAVSISAQFTLLYMVVTFGVSGGCGVLAAQYWGANNKKAVRDVFAFMYRIVAFISIFFALSAFFLAENILSFMIQDPEVIAKGVEYLNIISIGYLFFGFASSTVGLLRSTGTVKIAVMTSFFSLIICIVLNYGLIFGNLGLPALGVSGAAISTSVTWFVFLLTTGIYLLKFENNIKFRIKGLFNKNAEIRRQYITHCIPVLINEIGWAIANFILAIIIARMGREVVSANSIGMLLFQFIGIIIFGISGAASTIIGNTIGAGRKEQAQQYAMGLLLLSFFVGIIGAIIIQLIRVPLINFYEISDQARQYALEITNVVSVIVIFKSIAMVSLMGTLRGGGDAKFVLVADIIFMWLLAIPLGAFFGLYLQLPIYLVFIAIRCEDFFKAITVLWRIPSGKWIKEVTK
jgi:putative MATE family efflux protein